MSLLLDTDVASELLRPSPNPAVEDWVAERPAAELYFSSVGEAGGGDAASWQAQGCVRQPWR